MAGSSSPRPSYKPSLSGRAGVYKLGGYYDTARFTDLTTGDSHRGNWSLYLLGDQTVYAGAEGVPDGGRLRRGRPEPPRRTATRSTITRRAGVNVTGLVPARPKDVLGVGATYTRLQQRTSLQANRAAGTPVTSQEAIIEFTYQAVITPFLTLQPDLQFVVDANQSRRDAVVLGIRMVATF